MLHTAADGNGPVNALDAALRKALRAFYPALDDVHLVDYKVRILDGDAATAARTRVIIDSQDGARTWSTMGSRHEHHRGVRGGARRLARVRHLEVRRRAAAARRAPLHDRRAPTPDHGRPGCDPEVARMPIRPTPPPVTDPSTSRAGRSRRARNSRSAAAPSSSTPASHHWRASAEGNGAIDALFRAVDKALAEILDGHPRLLAYDVHALGEGTDADRRGHGPDRAAATSPASAARASTRARPAARTSSRPRSRRTSSRSTRCSPRSTGRAPRSGGRRPATRARGKAPGRRGRGPRAACRARRGRRRASTRPTGSTEQG